MNNKLTERVGKRKPTHTPNIEIYSCSITDCDTVRNYEDKHWRKHCSSSSQKHPIRWQQYTIITRSSNSIAVEQMIFYILLHIIFVFGDAETRIYSYAYTTLWYIYTHKHSPPHHSHLTLHRFSRSFRNRFYPVPSVS